MQDKSDKVMEDLMAKVERDRAEQIEFLREQAKEAKRKWFRDGKITGIEVALEMDYDKFRYVSHFVEQYGLKAIENYEELAWTEELDWIKEMALQCAVDSPISVPTYIKGCVEGILVVWERVKDDVEAEDDSDP